MPALRRGLLLVVKSVSAHDARRRPGQPGADPYRTRSHVGSSTVEYVGRPPRRPEAPRPPFFTRCVLTRRVSQKFSWHPNWWPLTLTTAGSEAKNPQKGGKKADGLEKPARLLRLTKQSSHTLANLHSDGGTQEGRTIGLQD